MYATKAEIDRTVLPRALIARAAGHDRGLIETIMSAPSTRRRRVYRGKPWRFNVGRVVKLGMLTGLIHARRRTALGREVYTVRILGENYGREFRDILGSAAALE